MGRVLSKDLFNDVIKQYNGFGVGLHCVDPTGICPIAEQTEIAEKILQTNLEIKSNYRISDDIYPAGVIGKRNLRVLKNIRNYGKGNVNIILLLPPYIKNSKDEKFYFGFTNNFEKGSSYDKCTPLSYTDEIWCQLGYIPKEFILGYYVESKEQLHTKKDIVYEFVKNNSFCNSIKVSDELFNAIKKTYDYIELENQDKSRQLRPYDSFLDQSWDELLPLLSGQEQVMVLRALAANLYPWDLERDEDNYER